MVTAHLGGQAVGCQVLWGPQARIGAKMGCGDRKAKAG